MKAGIACVTVAALVGLSACVTPNPTPYQALAERPDVGGYADVSLAADRYQVSFVGNSDTPQSAVDSYMLYRAAELALDKGYDWFTLADRRSVQEAGGSAVRDMNPLSIEHRWPDPAPIPRPGRAEFGAGRTVLVVSNPTPHHFKASADVQFGRGPKPVGKPAALDARDVLARLAPMVASQQGLTAG